jgi:ABC-2 type transport system permease protein
MNEGKASPEPSTDEVPVAGAVPPEPARRRSGEFTLFKARTSKPSYPLLELTLARMREFVREPEALFWVFVFPILLAFALGIAFRNTTPEPTRTAITAGPLAREIADALSQPTGIQAKVLPAEEAVRELRTGKVDLVVGGTNEPGSAFPSIEYRYDPTRAEGRAARLVVNDALQRAFGRKEVAAARDSTTIEPGARYIDFLIPGLIGLNLMGSGMWGVGFVVVQSRTQKLLKRLAATPMRRSHFLLSFMLSRLVFLVCEVVAVLAFASIAFDVAVRGSLLDLAILSFVGAMMFAGLGLLIAARCKTIEGVSGWMNLVMLPMWLLSGTFFSAARFPAMLQPFIKALPLTALNDALRAVINEGRPLYASWVEVGILFAWGLASFIIALRIFRWQ